MPHFAQSWGWLIVVGALAVSPRHATAVELGAPLPMRGQVPVEPGARRAEYLHDEDLSRPAETADASSGPARFPVRFTQRAERQASADEATPSHSSAAEHKNPQLLPPSAGARPGLRTGEVPSLLTGAASLGIVLGLFLLVVLVMRRGMPKSVALLPREAVEVLGRAPLVGKQQVHLVRCGNKVLLLCASANGVETLTEITDPAEVDRLSGLCQQTQPERATASFGQVFQKFGGQPRSAQYFSSQQIDDLDFGHLDAPRGLQESHA